MQMKVLAATLASLCLICASSAHGNPTKSSKPGVHSMLTRNDVRTVAPALDQYTQDRVLGDLWRRPGLSPRDRSLTTVSALIASGQVAQMPYHLNRAMDNGLTQAEASEVFTQLAFYAGWPNVFSALPVAKEVFEKRR